MPANPSPVVETACASCWTVAKSRGPSRLKYVQAVVQLETHWKDVVEIVLGPETSAATRQVIHRPKKP